MARFTFQPRVTRIPRRPIFTWHPHKARFTSYTCKDTQLKTSGAKHRILIPTHSWGTEKHTDGSNGNSISALRWRGPWPLRNSAPILMSRMAAEPQDKNFHCYIITRYWKSSCSPGKAFGEYISFLFGIHLYAQHRGMGICQPTKTTYISSPGNGSPPFPGFWAVRFLWNLATRVPVGSCPLLSFSRDQRESGLLPALAQNKIS